VARKEEKPSLGKRLTEWAMTAGVLVLIGGLVCAFLVAGIFVLHHSLSRNEDENMVVREGTAKSPEETKQSALEDLKRPLPPPPAVSADPKNVAVKPQDLADVAPAPAKPLEKPKEAPKPVTPPAVAEKPKEAPKAPAPPPAPEKPKVPVVLPPPAPPVPPAAKVPAGPPSRDPSRMDNEGFIRYWLILSPLPSEKERASGAEVAALRLPNEASMTPKPGETVSYKGKNYVWTKHNAPDYFIDFKKFVGDQKSDNVLAYAVAYVSCEEELRDVKVLAGTNDAGRVYINGKVIFSHEKSRSLEPDASIVNGITLQKGQNVIILKVANETGNWGGCLRFMDKNGTPIRHLLLSSMPH
jgi:outer membrane biosynthesis protein TonB